jgi:hypothetical protein
MSFEKLVFVAFLCHKNREYSLQLSDTYLSTVFLMELCPNLRMKIQIFRPKRRFIKCTPGLGDGAIVPDVSLVRKAVGDVPELALLYVLEPGHPFVTAVRKVQLVSQGCQIFLGTTYQNGENYTK